MSDSEWKPLIYTADCEGPYMRWDGKIFPLQEPQYTFDVRLQNGATHLKCLVRARGFSQSYADAITLNGDVIGLQHGDLLRPANVSTEELKVLRDIAFNLLTIECRTSRITELESRKAELSAELAKIDAELAKLKKEASE